MAKRKSRYREICQAYNQGVTSCDEYRKTCFDFVNDLRTALIENLDIPETKVFLYPPSKGFILRDHRFEGGAFETEFVDGGVALIGFAINANDTKPEDRFFTVIVSFKRIEGEMFFSLVEDDQEFPGNHEGMVLFCDYLFETAAAALKRRLDFFLESPAEESAPIGFKVNRES
jgi:hypothetical protein